MNTFRLIFNFLHAGQGRGPERGHRADGRSGRSFVQGLQRDAGLLERRGDDEEGDPRRRVAQIRVFFFTTQTHVVFMRKSGLKWNHFSFRGRQFTGTF